MRYFGPLESEPDSIRFLKCAAPRQGFSEIAVWPGGNATVWPHLLDIPYYRAPSIEIVPTLAPKVFE